MESNQPEASGARETFGQLNPGHDRTPEGRGEDHGLSAGADAAGPPPRTVTSTLPLPSSEDPTTAVAPAAGAVPPRVDPWSPPSVPRYPGASRGRALAATLVALAAVAAVPIAIHLADARAANRLTGALEPSHEVALSFPTTAPLAALLVHPGESVRAGQVLARQSLPGLDAALRADESAVAAELTRVSSLSHLLGALPGATSAANASASQAAASRVGAAEQLLATAKSVGSSAVAAIQSAVTADGQLLASAESDFAASCPNGVPSGAAGVPCARLEAEVSADRAALQAAQGRLAAVTATSEEWQAEAAHSVAVAQADSGVATDPSPAVALESLTAKADLADAEASLATAKAQLAEVEAEVRAGTLVAPAAGRVLAVAGVPGEVVGSAGSRALFAPPPGQSALPFQLTPTTSSSGAASSSAPIVTLALGDGWNVDLLVPESRVEHLRVGEPAHVRLSGSGTRLAGRISAILERPTTVGSTVDYPVVVTLEGTPPAGALAGMTATVRFLSH